LISFQWMKDSRGRHAQNDDDEYPCIKCFTTIDAPMEDVCDYLSNENHMGEYNDLVVAHRDLENISPHGKICWSQCPQILFIKVIQLSNNNHAILIIIVSCSHLPAFFVLAKRFCYILSSPLETRWLTDSC